MPFYDARVPGQGETGDDSVAVAVDSGGEGVEAGQVVVADGVEPLGQPLALPIGEGSVALVVIAAVLSVTVGAVAGLYRFQPVRRRVWRRLGVRSPLRRW
ncbi:hypothetical protein B1H19_02250 [Streptomyces gilvosporeus]|uniref:Uncharacterized protein n=1 Tax=Streptomyces gilvosporeus TaxID=553510 RepID=A0A1V0TJN7_9ACTN|nr:hypothetical protein B1H19_02250 [Streptomyces gilvosporeus]